MRKYLKLYALKHLKTRKNCSNEDFSAYNGTVYSKCKGHQHAPLNDREKQPIEFPPIRSSDITILLRCYLILEVTISKHFIVFMKNTLGVTYLDLTSPLQLLETRLMFHIAALF